MEPGERRTFNCVIKSKAQEQDGYKLELEVAEFRSNYPTTITRVPETLASILEPGNSYPLVLERQNLKKNKDRSKPYNWYWGLVDLGNSLADGPSDVTYEPIFDETPGEAERST
ncbi:hypothetical protein CMI37_19445, partial [Candidatus Pacearchaeota archaeon]|nr:hypothetical protein [Candidatus Pacearchaeota archaeon]